MTGHSNSPESRSMFDFLNLDKKTGAKIALGAALFAAMGGVASAQETQETPDPNVHYTSTVVGESANLRIAADSSASRIGSLSQGAVLEISLAGTNDGYDWAQVWKIDGVDVDQPTFVAIRSTNNDLILLSAPVEIENEESPAVAAPEAPEDVAGTESPEILETPAADGTIIEVTPVMQSTAEFAMAHAETEAFEFAKQEWLAGGELGPFSGIPPILFMQSTENIDLAGNITPFAFNTNALYTLEYGGQEYQFNGVDALRLTLMQAIAATNGEIHSAQDFENFMAGFANGEGTLGEVTGMNWETGEREVFEFDATQPVTMIVRGLYSEEDRGLDLDALGLKSTQWGVYNHYTNQQGGLVIEMWLNDRQSLDGRIEQDPRTVTWTLGKLVETGIAVLPATADPLDGQSGIDLNGVFRPYNPNYRQSNHYAHAEDIFDDVDEGGEASYERFLPLFTTQLFRFDEMPIRFDDGQS